MIDYLNQISAGEVKTLLCADIVEVLADLESSRVSQSLDFTIVVQSWAVLPDQQGVIDDVLRSLAEISLMLWPSWYNQDNLFHASSQKTLEDQILNQLAINTLRAAERELCLPWVKAAVALCQAGKLPIVEQFSRALQVSQLMLAIQPEKLFLLLSVNDPNPPAYRRLGFARAATWLAAQTGIRVAVLLPASLAYYAELDSILYGAISIPSLAPFDSDTANTLETKFKIWPIRGKPHPFSPGEQKLAEKLAADAELGGLFRFNQSVRTVRDSSYLVDLLWPDGRVIVEVDGYRQHGNRFSFLGDRHRDYELLISGYLVLRLPHDEVMTDIEIAIDKIRDVVQFRNSQNKSFT